MSSKRAFLKIAFLAAMALICGNVTIPPAAAQKGGEEFVEEEAPAAKPKQAGESEFFEESDAASAPAAAKAAPAKPLLKPNKDSLISVALAIFALGAVSMMLRVIQREATGETDAAPAPAAHGGHDAHHH